MYGVVEGKCIRFWRGNREERDHLDNLGLTGSIKWKWVLKRNKVGWYGLGLSGSGGTFGFHKMWGLF
jgi:hypothetical protein